MGLLEQGTPKKQSGTPIDTGLLIGYNTLMNSTLDTIRIARGIYMMMVGDETSTPDTVDFYIEVEGASDPIEIDRDHADTLLSQHNYRCNVHGHYADQRQRRPVRKDHPTTDDWADLVFAVN